MINGLSNSALSSLTQYQRPDPTQIASTLFSKLDTTNKGYLDASDLQTALSQLSSSSSSSSSSDASAVLKQLDSDGDGKVTESELSASLKKIADQLDTQLMSARMGGGQPPMGPPPGADDSDDAGLSKDQLTKMVKDLSASSDTQAQKMATDLTQVLNNFDKADSNGDGKVTRSESMAYLQSQDASSSTSTSTSTSTGTSTSTTASSTDNDANIIRMIMQLAHAYGSQTQPAQSASSVSTSV